MGRDRGEAIKFYELVKLFLKTNFRSAVAREKFQLWIASLSDEDER